MKRSKTVKKWPKNTITFLIPVNFSELTWRKIKLFHHWLPEGAAIFLLKHCVQIWQKRREKLLKLKLCIFVLSRVHLECTNMILVKSDPTKVIKAKLKALRLPKSRLCTIIFVFYAAFESVCIELQSLWDLSWLKVLKAKKATRNIQN